MASLVVIGAGFGVSAVLLAAATALGYNAKKDPAYQTPASMAIPDFTQSTFQESFKRDAAKLKEHMNGRERLWTYIGRPDDPQLYQRVEQGVSDMRRWLDTCTPTKDRQPSGMATINYHGNVQIALSLLTETGLLDKEALPSLGSDKKGLPVAYPVASPLAVQMSHHFPQIAQRVAQLLGMQFANRVKHEEVAAMQTELASLKESVTACVSRRKCVYEHSNWTWYFYAPDTGRKPISDLITLTNRVTQAWNLVYPEYNTDRHEEFLDTLTETAKISTAILRIVQEQDFQTHFSKEATAIEGALAHIKATYCDVSKPVPENPTSFIFEAAAKYLNRQASLWFWQRWS